MFQLAQNKGTKVYSQKATQSGDKLGRFIPHKNKDTGQVKVTINEDGEEVRDWRSSCRDVTYLTRLSPRQNRQTRTTR